MRINLSAGIVLLLLAIPAGSAHAQSEVAERVRVRCRAASQQLDAQRAARGDARERIVSCPKEGPAYLAAEWRRVADDTTAVDWLLHHSGRVRDARLFAQLRQAALDRSRGDVVRVGAMLALMKLADPYGSYWFSDVRPETNPLRPMRVVGGSTTAGHQLNGEHPLGPQVAPAVLAIFERVARDQAGESESVWYAAAALEKRVRFNMEHGLGR